MSPTQQPRGVWVAAAAGAALLLALAVFVLGDSGFDGNAGPGPDARPVPGLLGDGRGELPGALPAVVQPEAPGAPIDTTPLLTDPAVEGVSGDERLVAWHGRVIDGDGKPVAGATVNVIPRMQASFTYAGGSVGAAREREEGRQGKAVRVLVPDLAERPTALSDDAGRVELVLPWPWPRSDSPDDPTAARAVVLVRHPAFATLVTERWPPTQARADLGDLVLASPPASVIGRLTNADGRPLADGTVTVTDHTPDRDLLRAAADRNGMTTGASPALPHGDHALVIVDAFSAHTDADGRFTLGGLVPGYVDLELGAPGHQTRAKSVSVTGGAVVNLGQVPLERAATIVARVVGPLGEPVVGATVLAYDGLDDPVLSRTVWSMSVSDPDADLLLLQLETLLDDPGTERAQTGADGRALLDRLGVRLHALFVDAPGFEPLLRDDVLPDRTEVTLALQREAVLALSLLDADTGEPLAAANVSARRASERADDGLPGALGTQQPVQRVGDLWLIPRVGRLGTWLEITAPGYERRVHREPGALPGSRRELTLSLPREVPFSGTVRGPDGQPVAEASARLRWTPRGTHGSPDEHGLHAAQRATDERGHFAFDGLGPGLATVEVSAPDDSLAPSDPLLVTVPVDRTPVQLEIVLRPAATLRVSVIEESGAPVTGESVYSSRVASDPPTLIRMAQHRTDDAGLLTVGGLPPGSYRVWTARAERHMELAAGADVELQLVHREPRVGVVDGVVLHGGVPVAGARVRLQRGALFVAQTVADDDGRFSANVAEPGSLDVVVLPPTSSAFNQLATAPPLPPIEAPASGIVLAVDWARLRARVVDEAGSAVRCAVSLHEPGRPAPNSTIVTDASGRVDLGWASPGVWELWAAPGDDQPLASGEPQRVSVPPYSEGSEVTLVAQPAGWIDGVVLAAPGIDESRPQRVFAWPDGAPERVRALKNRQRFQFANLPVGPWRLAAVLDVGLAVDRPADGQLVQVRAGQHTAVELVTRAP